MVEYIQILNETENIGMDEKYLLKLLGREPVQIANEEILNFVKDKTVLITGGGGSIGSELCRTVAKHSPKKIVLVDIYENSTYFLQQELVRNFGENLDLEVYIVSVCDKDQLNAIFDAEKPQIVIHAAAHKHVPLMEKVPIEAVKNNVFGTLNVTEACATHSVESFILISSDKAVNPTSVMGTTKRICEMIVQNASKKFPQTHFTAVRFGNVIGSNGSVIPLFKEQIKSGTVTVSHPEIYRFFMTVSEAAQLVLTAGAIANGGEIFVLDMGEQVNISDIAKKMIELEGLEEGKDIKIIYTGLRPGEKLYEEMLLDAEGLKKTANEKIFVGQPINIDSDRFEEQIVRLHKKVNSPTTQNSEVLKILHETVPEYKGAEKQEASK